MTAKGKSILIVDDESSFCRLLERMLSGGNYYCRWETSGSAALARLAEESFDLVMTDICMPEMDGLQLIEKICQQFPAMAILVTTGISEREVAHKALELGAYGYLLKPCNEFEVLLQVVNALRRAELEALNKNYQQELQVQVAQRTEELEASNQALAETNRMLRHQDKLASIGQLAAGIAHEIKTPTGFVASNLSSLEKYQHRMISYIAAQEKIIASSASAEQQKELQQIACKIKLEQILADAVELVHNCQDGTGRITSIMQGLKDFSHQDQNGKKRFDLNQALEDSLLLVRNELKYKAEVKVQTTGQPILYGSRQRMSQVFINLLVNATHAIRQRGKITVSTSSDNGNIVVQVADDGCGIPAENLEKIFEPFFTTKDIGIGTGLGLSIIKEIVEDHQGTITVESTLDEGTVFTLRFQTA